MSRYLESAAARNEEDASARVLESGAATGDITETWTGTDGAGWPAQWTCATITGSPSTGTNTIQSNRGRMTVGGAAYSFRLARLSNASTDVDITYSYACASTSEHYPETFWRVGGYDGFGFPINCYALEIQPNVDAVALVMIDGSASGNPVVTVNSAGVNTTAQINVRILHVGNSIKVRWWTGTEPGTWQITYTDATYTTGAFAFGLYSGNTSLPFQVDYDDFALVVPAPPAAVPAKGVGVVYDASDVSAAPGDLANLETSWWYNWASYSVSGIGGIPATPSIEYVPMMWGDWINDARWGTATGDGSLGGDPASSIGPSNILLGFNEPNVAEQANMTVARSLALWPQLEATGALLGSPAVSGDPGLGYGTAWLSSFMSGNGGAAPRVDFICAHWYPQYDAGYSNVGDYLDYLHTTYGKPIWITEIGTLGGDFAANAALMATVMTALSTRPWVERIAWFVQTRQAGGAGWPTSMLTSTSGVLNTAGTAYKAYPAGTLPPENEILQGTATGVSTTTGALTVARSLSGTTGGLSTTTGAMAVGRALVGTSTGVSTDTGVMAVARALAGTSIGQSTVTGDLAGSSAKTLDGSAAGLSTTTGALSVTRGLAGQSAGLSTAGATAMVAQRALVGSAGGLSTTTGALARAVPLAGSTDGTSAASATTLATAGLPGGMSNGAATATGALVVARALVATTTGQSSTTGALARAVPLAGSAAGLSTATGALTVARTLVGSASGVSTAGGTSVTVARALAGSTSGLSTTTGNLLATAAGGLSGFTAGLSGATGSLSVARPLAGTSGGTGATTGALVKAIPLASTSAVGVGSATGVIARGVALTATSDGASTTTADTRVARSLAGTSTGLSTANASLTVARALAGSSSGTSNATGTLQAINIEEIFGLWNGQTFEAMQWGDQQVVDFMIIPP